MTADVFASPALPLLLRLEAEGFEIQAGPDVLRVRPVARVTSELRAELQAHKTDLLMLVRICDAGVTDRRETFRLQIETAPPGVLLPRLVFVEHRTCGADAIGAATV